MQLKLDWFSDDVHLLRTTYLANNAPAIFVLTSDEELFADLTVCLPDAVTPASCSYVDTNNCSWAEDFIINNKLGEPMGIKAHSGFCEYPLYKFDLNKIPEVQDE